MYTVNASYLDQDILPLSFIICQVNVLVAVAALKGFKHGGNGERQKKEPDDNGDLR